MKEVEVFRLEEEEKFKKELASVHNHHPLFLFIFKACWLR
jgi:hypothetical protein